MAINSFRPLLDPNNIDPFYAETFLAQVTSVDRVAEKYVGVRIAGSDVDSDAYVPDGMAKWTFKVGDKVLVRAVESGLRVEDVFVLRSKEFIDQLVKELDEAERSTRVAQERVTTYNTKMGRQIAYLNGPLRTYTSKYKPSSGAGSLPPIYKE